jgi:prephenate dehydrogenase (NADP+)
MGAIVGGQTSCKAPEIAAFEKHLPSDVHIVSCHSLHGPGVDPKGQPLVLIKHRASDEAFALVENMLSCLASKHVYLTREQHDRITADTQAVTHAAFLSMGAAWMANNQFPWEYPRYIGGIENVKINITLRIYANKWHVYAGLAILNPDAQKQIKQYAESVTELFKLMLAGHKEELRERIMSAREAVFGGRRVNEELLLRDEVLDRFSLGEIPEKRLKNNHLSLLAMVDCWWKLGIVPYDHMICSTPVRPHVSLLIMCLHPTALPHVARHHRVPLPAPLAPRRSHRHGHRRQHVPRRRPRIHLCGARLEPARQPWPL